MNMPLISIVTPSLNQGNFIEDNILSVLAQKYPNFEHIIIDAGSTDETISVLKKYPHLKWVSEPDKGQSDGLNKGFMKASGDWILWLNADDFLMPDVLATYSKVVSQNSDVDLFYGHFYFVDNSNKLIKSNYAIPYNYGMLVFKVSCPASTGSLFRASILKENLLSIDYHYMMDIEWFLRVGKKIHTIMIDKVLSCFRISNNKTSTQILYGKCSEQQLIEQKRIRETYIFPWYTELPCIASFNFKILRLLFFILSRIQKSKYIYRRLKEIILDKPTIDWRNYE